MKNEFAIPEFQNCFVKVGLTPHAGQQRSSISHHNQVDSRLGKMTKPLSKALKKAQKAATKAAKKKAAKKAQLSLIGNEKLVVKIRHR